MIILESGISACINEPRGDNGLEGFQLNEIIKYERVETETDNYYRVWSQSWEKDEYKEICSTVIFSRYFTKISDNHPFETEESWGRVYLTGDGQDFFYSI